MAITVNWRLDPNAVKYHLYRATTPIDLGALPTDHLVIAAEDVTVVNEQGAHEYVDAVRQTVYYFVVGTENAAGELAFTEQTVFGYFPESGPGPQTLQRGDWSFGYFGEISAVDFLTYATIFSTMAANGFNTTVNTTGNNSGAVTTWYKCVVNGRIVFIPDMYWYSNATYTAAAGAGIAQGDVDYNNTKSIVKFGESEFLLRLPYAHTTAPSDRIVDAGVLEPMWRKSEVGMVMALCNYKPRPVVGGLPGIYPTSQLLLCDNNYGYKVLSGTVVDNNNRWQFNITTDTMDKKYYSYIDTILPVLELLF